MITAADYRETEKVRDQLSDAVIGCGIHEAQLLTYLHFSGKKTGLLLNFNECYLKNGILRRVL